MNNKIYFLCSQAVIDHLHPSEVSKPFLSGYKEDSDKHYVAVLDSDDAETYYDEVIEPYNEKSRVAAIEFWYRPCDPGSMDVSAITLKACREQGLFKAIENMTDLTTMKNVALCINNLAEKFNCTPIEFINKIRPTKAHGNKEKEGNMSVLRR